MSARPPTQGARRSHAERRAESEQRLLEVTVELVAEQGTDAMSLADIAAAAGCSRGLPVYLFGSKQGLLMAVVDTLMERFRSEFLEPAIAGRVGVEATLVSVEAFLDPLTRPGVGLRAFNVLVGEAIGPRREYAVPINRLHRKVHAQLAGHLREAVALGEVRTDIDVDLEAWSLVALLRGSTVLTLADPEAFDARAYIAATVEGVRRSLGTLRP